MGDQAKAEERNAIMSLPPSAATATHGVVDDIFIFNTEKTMEWEEERDVLFHQATIMALVTVATKAIGWNDIQKIKRCVSRFYNVNETFIQYQIIRAWECCQGKNKTNVKQKWLKQQTKNLSKATTLSQEQKESVIKIAVHTYFEMTGNTQLSSEMDACIAEIGWGVGMEDSDHMATFVARLLEEKENADGRIVGSSLKTNAVKRLSKNDAYNVKEPIHSILLPGPLLH